MQLVFVVRVAVLGQSWYWLVEEERRINPIAIKTLNFNSQGETMIIGVSYRRVLTSHIMRDETARNN